ncbi:MAG: phage/plasmid replication protein, II/X family [Nitrospiraceae bacterium]|nr:phage/plasmid replication protein, II/X family [Nitrospiraceae bacterium]
MIDTVGCMVRISTKLYSHLQRNSLVTQRIEQTTGHIQFEYHNLAIAQSWNYKVLIKLTDEIFKYDSARGVPEKAAGYPHLRLEFSVPKIICGHNLESFGAEGFKVACILVKKEFEKVFSCELPEVLDWYIYRVDTCANFVLPFADMVHSYLDYLKRMDYPRKPKSVHSTGLYFATRYSTFKVYEKGPEFRLHDLERIGGVSGGRVLKDFDGVADLQQSGLYDSPSSVLSFEGMKLYQQAKKILRFEAEHRHGKMRYLVEDWIQRRWLARYDNFNSLLFQGFTTLKNVLYLMDFEGEMEKEMNRILSGRASRVMKAGDVLRLLQTCFSKRQAKMMYSTFIQLTTMGQGATKSAMTKTTYYRHLEAFRELGISIIATDMQPVNDFTEMGMDEYMMKFSLAGLHLDRGFPDDFSLRLSPENRYYQVPKAA